MRPPPPEGIVEVTGHTNWRDQARTSQRRDVLKAVPEVGKTQAEEALARIFKTNRIDKLVVYPQARRVLTAAGQEVPGRWGIVNKALMSPSERPAQRQLGS